MNWSLRFSLFLKYQTKKHICSHYGKRLLSLKVDTKELANLRKNTGYSLLLCKEALLENNNDLKLARAWLDEQAIKKGWQKAEKLQNKKISEGLIGVMVKDNHVAMVEVCCETDFVAQNEFFKELVSEATLAALSHRRMIVDRGLDLGGAYTHFREVLLTHKLVEMKLPNSDESLNDRVHQVVGRLGERIMLKRAITMTTERDTIVGRYTHGPFTPNVDGCHMGKYAAVVTLQPRATNLDTGALAKLATSLSQHVVGMNPSCISTDSSTEKGTFDKGEIFEEQQFLMDEAITVRELLDRNNVTIVDFLRMECGCE